MTPCGWAGWFRGQVVRAARQLRAGRCLHHQRVRVSGHTARQQVRVSEVGLQREPDPSRQRQRGEEVIPEQVIVVGHIFRVVEQQASPRLLGRLALEEAVAADVDEDRAGGPRGRAPAGSLQEREHQWPIQPAVQAEDLIRKQSNAAFLPRIHTNYHEKFV